MSLTWDELISTLCPKSEIVKNWKQDLEDKLWRKLDSTNYLLMNTQQYYEYTCSLIKENNVKIVPRSDYVNWLNMMLIFHDAFLFLKTETHHELGSENAEILLEYTKDTQELIEHLSIHKYVKNNKTITYNNKTDSGFDPFKVKKIVIPDNLDTFKKDQLIQLINNLLPGTYKKTTLTKKKKNDLLNIVQNYQQS
jgi:hypothetical protein